MTRPSPAQRESFQRFFPVPTRWADNDIYGHVNNVVYYAWFDTAVNQYLIEAGGMRPGVDSVVGYVVSSGCHYFMPVAYPQRVDLGLRILRLGEKSVTWEIGVFVGDETVSRATGQFTHAFVDQVSAQAAAIPPAIRSAIENDFDV